MRQRRRWWWLLLVVLPAGLAVRPGSGQGPGAFGQPPAGGVPAGGQPWERDLEICVGSSPDRFGSATTLVKSAGVPSAVRLPDGTVLLAMQWFPDRTSPAWDRVAVIRSIDGGQTWSAPTPIVVAGLPGSFQRPFDPTLAVLPDGRLRIYFSSHQRPAQPGGPLYPATYSALGSDGVHYQFEPGARFAVAQRGVIDPAVWRIGDTWHLTAPIGRPQDGAYHATSNDGLQFTRQADLASVGGVNWTGNLVAAPDGVRFYGSGPQGIWYSTTSEGATWSAPRAVGQRGGDPTVVAVAADRWLLIRVSDPRSGAPGRPTAGPYVHQVQSASSPDGLTWTRDPGVRLEHASVPCAVNVDDRLVRLYFVDADRGDQGFETTAVAESTDGLTFTKHDLLLAGQTHRKVLDPCVVRSTGGEWRLYYYACQGRPDGPGTHEVHLATSIDGRQFTQVGPVYAQPGLVDPDALEIGGQWLLYVFGNGGTQVAASRDGRAFTFRRLLEPRGYGTTAPVRLADGSFRLYAFEQFRQVGNAVASFRSRDGETWAREAGVRLQAKPDEQLTDPWVIPWQGGWKMYFKSSPPPPPPSRPAPR